MQRSRTIRGILTSGLLAGAVALAAGWMPVSAADKDAGAEPKLMVQANPAVAFSPAEISVRASLEGGSDHYQPYYCPSVEWNWGDGTTSESSSDCEPYQEGKSQIERHYFVRHVYRDAGRYRVSLSLKKDGKKVGSASTEVVVRPGLGG